MVIKRYFRVNVIAKTYAIAIRQHYLKTDITEDVVKNEPQYLTLAGIKLMLVSFLYIVISWPSMISSINLSAGSCVIITKVKFY